MMDYGCVLFYRCSALFYRCSLTHTHTPEKQRAAERETSFFKTTTQHKKPKNYKKPQQNLSYRALKSKITVTFLNFLKNSFWKYSDPKRENQTLHHHNFNRLVSPRLSCLVSRLLSLVSSLFSLISSPHLSSPRSPRVSSHFVVYAPS